MTVAEDAQRPMLELVGLRKRFTEADVVREVSLKLPRGALLTLLGPSGCGKSTLLRMIAGFVEPSSGHVIVNGRSVTNLRPERRPTAMLFQSYALFPHMTVFDNVAFGLKLRRMDKAAIKRKVADALSLVRMEGLARRFPAELSGGQQQRVALARCLVLEPEILLLDEPFGALDRQLRDQMQTELRKLQKQLGVTMVVVTHDQNEALVLSDLIAVMNAGEIVQWGAPAEVYDRPINRFVASFMGVTNIIPGEPIGESDNRAFRLPNGEKVEMMPGDCAQRFAHIAIRPENLAIVETSDPNAVFRGKVEFASLIGSAMSYEVEIGSMTLSVVTPRSTGGPRVGDIVGLAVRSENLIALKE
ncbi:ABC transporter ATP-binding protein [Bradyrhizobium prioriisuperbiae]|uniref:ABC transporter ATP-binding protein n=1 Tax=Bradyrhizobium prioriisuperbiae TaxID=2854389 RepID=UPI0028E3F3E7|nr:ABC transporter ATP-binding protein [Bradyrhizobium prioritasuperba]